MNNNGKNNTSSAFLIERAKLTDRGNVIILRFWLAMQNGLSLYGEPVIMDEPTARKLGESLSLDKAVSEQFTVDSITDGEGNSGKKLLFSNSKVTATIADVSARELAAALKRMTKEMREGEHD